MNDTMRNRLIGLAVILVVLFLLSWLIPRRQPVANGKTIPVTAVPVGGSARLASQAQPSGAASPSTQTSGATGSGEVQTQPYQAGGTEQRAADDADHSSRAAQLGVPSPSASKAEDLMTRPGQGAVASAPSKLARPLAPARHVQAPARTPAVSATTGSIYVQIGAYGDTANAQKVLSSLQQKGFHGSLDPIKVNGHKLYRVRVGPYSDKDSAGVAQRQLAGKGYKGTRVVSDS